MFPFLSLKCLFFELSVVEWAHKFQYSASLYTYSSILYRCILVPVFCIVVYLGNYSFFCVMIKTPSKRFLCVRVKFVSFCNLFRCNFPFDTLLTNHEKFKSSNTFCFYLTPWNWQFTLHSRIYLRTLSFSCGFFHSFPL